MTASERRVALLTGARRGLGFATAEALARLGLRVVLTARDAADAVAAAESLAAQGPATERWVVEGRPLDVTDDASVSRCFDDVLAAHGRIDVLVNNAGTIFESALGEGPSAVERAFDVPVTMVAQALDNNALGAYRTMQKAVPLMKAAGYGRVVNVSSGMGGIAEMGGGWPAYRASKAAMNAFTRMFHAAAGPQVKVNAVCPGWVRTAMGGPQARRSVEEGIAGIVWAATLAEDGPSGGFFRDGKPIAW